jgi:hypothetical protein
LLRQKTNLIVQAQYVPLKRVDHRLIDLQAKLQIMNINSDICGRMLSCTVSHDPANAAVDAISGKIAGKAFQACGMFPLPQPPQPIGKWNRSPTPS